MRVEPGFGDGELRAVRRNFHVQAGRNRPGAVGAVGDPHVVRVDRACGRLPGQGGRQGVDAIAFFGKDRRGRRDRGRRTGAVGPDVGDAHPFGPGCGIAIADGVLARAEGGQGVGRNLKVGGDFQAVDAGLLAGGRAEVEGEGIAVLADQGLGGDDGVQVQADLPRAGVVAVCINLSAPGFGAVRGDGDSQGVVRAVAGAGDGGVHPAADHGVRALHPQLPGGGFAEDAILILGHVDGGPLPVGGKGDDVEGGVAREVVALEIGRVHELAVGKGRRHFRPPLVPFVLAGYGVPVADEFLSRPQDHGHGVVFFDLVVVAVLDVVVLLALIRVGEAGQGAALADPGVVAHFLDAGQGAVVPFGIEDLAVAVQGVPGIVEEELVDGVAPDLVDAGGYPGRQAESFQGRGRVPADAIAVHIEIAHRVQGRAVGRAALKALAFDPFPDGEGFFLVGGAAPGDLRGHALDGEPVVESVGGDPGIDDVGVADVFDDDGFVGRSPFAFDRDSVGGFWCFDGLGVFVRHDRSVL